MYVMYLSYPSQVCKCIYSINNFSVILCNYRMIYDENGNMWRILVQYVEKVTEILLTSSPITPRIFTLFDWSFIKIILDISLLKYESHIALSLTRSQLKSVSFKCSYFKKYSKIYF